ncbi:MAG: type I restriction enzyme HsdR N-terminal domain-containing protein [Lachnospiraceae bacterium]|nr:type I restriction enzyme HsdR N-terminal domain-containing protein [Lachnospiraceae bacterium]
MGDFNKKAVVELQKKLQAKSSKPDTEEATKQWFVMPMLVALGYDPYSSDIIPEFTLDVGTKKGEKVDYALQINNQPVALVECKQLDVQLSDKQVSQLFRYFTVSDVHIAILTNGDDYWFFTDSEKENVMDLEPYCKIRLSEATDDELDKLSTYSKSLIQYADVSQMVQYERYVAECRELAHSLRNNNMPSWLLETLAQRSGLLGLDKPVLAEYLYAEIEKEFDGFKKGKHAEKTDNKQMSLGARMKATMEENKKNVSNIKLNHEYVYNDYSDGDWKFHKMDYATIFGKRYDNENGSQLLVDVLAELLNRGKIKRKDLLTSEDFGKDTGCKVSDKADVPAAKLVEGYDIYLGTKLDINGIIRFINKLLNFAGVADSEVKISFKE